MFACMCMYLQEKDRERHFVLTILGPRVLTGTGIKNSEVGTCVKHFPVCVLLCVSARVCVLKGKIQSSECNLPAMSLIFIFMFARKTAV